MSTRMKLDEIRRARGYSQEYMANQLGCHRNTYAKNGRKTSKYYYGRSI